MDQLGDPITARPEEARVEVGAGLLARVIDGFCKPIDSGPAIPAEDGYRDTRQLLLNREHITAAGYGSPRHRWPTPVRPGTANRHIWRRGVRKSMLLGSMARHSSADVAVIALIGERNREVHGFLEQALGWKAASAR